MHKLGKWTNQRQGKRDRYSALNPPPPRCAEEDEHVTEGGKKRLPERNRVGSVSVGLGSKEIPRNWTFGNLLARKKGREPKKKDWGSGRRRKVKNKEEEEEGKKKINNLICVTSSVKCYTNWVHCKKLNKYF